MYLPFIIIINIVIFLKCLNEHRYHINKILQRPNVIRNDVSHKNLQSRIDLNILYRASCRFRENLKLSIPFIDNYADIIALLTDRLEQAVNWGWTEVKHTAYKDNKGVLYDLSKSSLYDYKLVRVTAEQVQSFFKGVKTQRKDELLPTEAKSLVKHRNGTLRQNANT